MQLSKRTLLLGLSYTAAAIIALMPFHALLTVWAASAVGHYTAVRLWKEYLLVLLVAGALVLGWNRLKEIRTNRLALAITCYGGLQVLTGAIAYAEHLVSAKALGYAWVINLRFFLFFGVVWLLATQTDWLRRHYKPLVLIPAAIVVVFAILQYSVLPPNFLRHFGYGPNTISITETIDHKQQYTRVASTLRGANPLGAYLVIIISLLAVLARRDKRYYVGLLAALTALGFTFSRSAWLGAALSLAVLVWLSLRSGRAKQYLLMASGAFLVLAIGLTLALRHNDSFQNAIFHTDEHSTSGTSSNAGHVAAFKNGMHDVLHEPFGRGPGTAGPASTYNSGYAPRIAENYFVQVGQETGWLGLVLFLFITFETAQLLYRRRADTLGLTLFISLVGLTLVNMLLHGWADDTLAYVWWGLAGIALAQKVQREKS
jgi:hypothetical protein